MLKKALRIILVTFLVSLVMVLFAVPVLAFDARSGNTVTVPAGEVVEGDLYVAGASIVIDGTVNGDIFGAGQSLTINGTVNGGVSLAGRTIILNGNISNGARLAGQSIIVNSRIGRDLVVFGSDVAITGQSVISEDLVLGAGTAVVSGRVGGNIKGGVGDGTLADGVGGNIELEVNNLTISSTARIQGNLVYTSQREAIIQPGALVSGTTSHKMPEVREKGRAGGGVVWWILSFLMILVMGIILVLVAPKRITSMAKSIQSQPWKNLGWGAVVLFVTPIAAVIVMFTVVGLPLGLISLVLYGIALYLSQIPVAMLIGRLIIRQKRELEGKGLMIGALALGLLIIPLLGLIPYIGWIFILVAIIFGLGTLVTTLRGNAPA